MDKAMQTTCQNRQFLANTSSEIYLADYIEEILVVQYQPLVTDQSYYSVVHVRQGRGVDFGRPNLYEKGSAVFILCKPDRWHIQL